MELIKIEENSKYGYRDENGTIVIPAKYEDAKDFKENYAVVKYNGNYGVINSSDELVIDSIYSSIEELFLFFRCIICSENEEKESIFWYNCKGTLIHKGDAKALSDNFLCVSNGNNVGVIDQNGEQIINFLYEKIILKKNFFAVLRKGMIGIFDLTGRVVIDVICKSIEQVIINNDWDSLGADPKDLQKKLPSSLRTNILYHTRYNKKYCFDTNERNPSWNLKKEILSEQYFHDKRVFSRYTNSIEEINAPIIITTDSSKLIFLKDEGILPNSEYEDVQQLTQISYVVKRNDLYGIYRVDIKSLIIPIEYEAIKFYGGHTVLLCKDGLWGAKDFLLDEPSNIPFKVSISTDYLEIAILNDHQHYFGCKKINEYDGQQCYTIIKSSGDEIEFMGYRKFSTPFLYYDSSHIMTSIDDKFGFVSVDGYTSIPFKYDEIHPRDDERFDVRIGDDWGLLTLDGRDNFGIKLERPLPEQLDNYSVVQDTESECFGVVDKNGVLIIPAIYEHLFNSDDNELFYYLYNGDLDGNYNIHGYAEDNFNSYLKDHCSIGKSGVVSIKGTQILSGKYNYFEMQGEYIIAGRDGDYNYWAGSKYDGVYDLFNKQGELLIGGFREFLYDNNHELFVFSFGGEWKGYDLYPIDGQERSVDDYSVEYRGDDLWLILDKNLKTIIRNEDGEQKQFPKGFIGNVIIKKEGKKKRYIYNIPLKYLVKGFYLSEYSNSIEISSIIIKHGMQAVDIATGKTTKEFTHIEQITDKLFLFKDENVVGLTNIDSEVLIGNCFLITRPVSNYFFLAKEKTEKTCCVWLYDISNIDNPIAIAISDITKEKLVSLAERDCLKIKFNKNLSGLKSIALQTSDIFDAEFASKIAFEEKRMTHSLFYRNTSYFIRGEFTSNTSNNNDSTKDTNDYDDHDYEKDTWDAMTDGMYGDYPDEGYDGNYEFMGK